MKPWDCVAIVGVGLIGGSIGLALRDRKLATKVIGTGSRLATLKRALQVGAITSIVEDAGLAAQEADLIVVCSPVANIVERVRQLAPRCKPGTLITDVGSTKAEIVQDLGQNGGALTSRGDVRFIGSHPLAGNEKKGPEHARGDLFVGRTVVVTPTEPTPAEPCASICQFWTSLGAKVIQMDGTEHDRALAATSHFPHLAAAAIAAATPEEYLTLTASGWQDTTRIAGGDPALWRQIMLANRENLLASLDCFATLLADWKEALMCADANKLERLLSEAKRVRDAVGN